jgi:aspartyl-tRNA(Asn)/glutamyl-tRNA(Gln) amidotransferase subunit A
VRYGFRSKAGDDLLDMYTRSRSGGFGEEVQRRILLGTYALSSGYYDAYYLTAQRARTLITKSYERAFEACDFILMPAAPTLPFRIGEKTREPLAMYLSDAFTLGANLAGIPGLTVPVTPTAAGLPRAAQVLGPVDSEAILLRAGRVIEVHGERGLLGAEHEMELAWPGNP